MNIVGILLMTQVLEELQVILGAAVIVVETKN
jgi:hypothetical protein